MPIDAFTQYQSEEFSDSWNRRRDDYARNYPINAQIQRSQQKNHQRGVGKTNPMSAAGLFYFSSSSNDNRRMTQEGWITEQGDDINMEDCSLYPNGTFTAPFAFSCDTPAHPPIFVIHESAFSNQTGDYEYPLDLTQTLRIFLDITSYATRRYDSMRAEISFYRRKTGWLGCGWIYLPTFGLLDNLEICEEANPTCPVFPGRQVLELKVDHSPVFLSFLKMVHDDRVPYQMKLRIINNRHVGEELLCVMFQTRVDI
ncbi:hypothetical protein Ddc_03356 [Ditylenchus destructor]|nr:hypothetical protein Ddc_03356 [Ditylenchus destructor]